MKTSIIGIRCNIPAGAPENTYWHLWCNDRDEIFMLKGDGMYRTLVAAGYKALLDGMTDYQRIDLPPGVINVVLKPTWRLEAVAMLYTVPGALTSDDEAQLNRLYREHEQYEEVYERLATECDELHCPDYCSGEGLCEKCCIEHDLGHISDDIATVERQIAEIQGRARLPGTPGAPTVKSGAS